MLVIDWLQFIEKGLPLKQELSSMTVGVFDGVHRGHQTLIERVVSHNEINIPVVITFRQNKKADIQGFRERLAMFEKLGIQITIVVDFMESFRRMSGMEFLETILIYGNIGFFAVGSNFRCGYKLDTDAAIIKSFFLSRDISVEIVPEITEGALPISSSRIRIAIAGGDIQLAEKMLGWSIKDGDRQLNNML